MQRSSMHSIVIIFALSFIHSLAFAIERVSVSSTGVQGDDSASSPFVSADGRFVYFSSNSTNLVDVDTNDKQDVFVHDRLSGVTELLSITAAGIQANGGSSNPSASENGQFVVFESSADNLVNNDTNGDRDIFVLDRTTGMIEKVSNSSTGAQGNRNSYEPAISGDGRYITFESFANNLVIDDSNELQDIFVHDRNTRLTQRVSISSLGEQGDSSSFEPSISHNGQFIVFHSYAANLVESDSNNDIDIFVHDRNNAMTERLSVSFAGIQGNSSSNKPAISADGRYVAFYSYASNLVADDANASADIFVYDRVTKRTELISRTPTGELGNNSSFTPSLSADGRFVTFYSIANNLVDDDSNGYIDLFVNDRNTGLTQRVNLSTTDDQANNFSFQPSMSADGQFVGFQSYADNLVLDDTNENADIFTTDNNLVQFNGQLSVMMKPSSAVVAVGEKLRFRTMFTNHSNQTLSHCQASPVGPLVVNGQRQFGYYSWPLNVPNPQANTPIDIASGETAIIYIVVTPRVEMQREIKFDFTCEGAQATPISLENTVLVTAKTTLLSAEDYVQLKNDNRKTELIIDRNGSTHWTSYVVSITNTGTGFASVNLTASTNIAESVLRSPRLCEIIGGGNYQCINPLSEQIQIGLSAGETRQMVVFAHADQPIARKPVFNRIFVDARDQAGELVARNSIGVYTLN